MPVLRSSPFATGLRSEVRSSSPLGPAGPLALTPELPPGWGGWLGGSWGSASRSPQSISPYSSCLRELASLRQSGELTRFSQLAPKMLSKFGSGLHRSCIRIMRSPVLASCSGMFLFSAFKWHELFCKSITAPSCLIVWIESRNGVAFGTTSTINHIRVFRNSIGIWICL